MSLVIVRHIDAPRLHSQSRSFTGSTGSAVHMTPVNGRDASEGQLLPLGARLRGPRSSRSYCTSHWGPQMPH